MGAIRYSLLLVLLGLLTVSLMACSSDDEPAGPTNRAPSEPANDVASGSPLDGAVDAPLVPVLRWTCTDADGDTLYYNVHFGDTSPPPTVSAGQRENSYSPGALEAESTYYWQVVAKDESGATTRSEIWEFTVGPLFDAINLPYIQSVTLSTDWINGSDSDSNQIPAGTVVLYLTSEGRYGKFRVSEYGYNLTLQWATYGSDDSTYSEGTSLLVHGTWQCDLDLGVEGDLSADFFWMQATEVERYMVPRNGAELAVL
jgi:hypothetical protein